MQFDESLGHGYSARDTAAYDAAFWEETCLYLPIAINNQSLGTQSMPMHQNKEWGTIACIHKNLTLVTSDFFLRCFPASIPLQLDSLS